MKELKCKGEWWLPENPEKKIPGDLEFNPIEGARLELIGSFNELYFTSGKKGLKTFGIKPTDYKLRFFRVLCG